MYNGSSLSQCVSPCLNTRCLRCTLHSTVCCTQNGYWKRWQLLRGGNAEGTLDWEEGWWEASDYTGLKEMGAEKKGEWVGCAFRLQRCLTLVQGVANLGTNRMAAGVACLRSCVGCGLQPWAAG